MNKTLTAQNNLNALSTGKVELGKNYLKVLALATDDDLTQIFDSLSTLKGGSLFWLGDFLVYTELNKGEAYAKALAGTDYDPQTLYNAKWVCKSLPPEKRANLSYSHHFQSLGECKGDTEQAIKFLKMAESENLSTREMRKYIRQSLGSARCF